MAKKLSRSEELRKRLRSWIPPPNKVFKDRKREQQKKACRGKPKDD